MILLSALFVLVFISAVSVIYTTTRLGIPPMPSNPALRSTVLEVLREAGSADRIVDLGAGWGGLARAAATAYPHRRVEAVEISWVPFLFTKAVGAILGPGNLKVRRRRIERERLDGNTVYLCYLSPAGMERVAEAIERSSAAPLRIVSAAFALPGAQPLDGRVAADLMQTPVYLYRLQDEAAE